MSLVRLKVTFLMQESRMGGIEYNSIQLAKALDAKRFHVVFFCPREGKLTLELSELGFEWQIYNAPNFFSTSTRIGTKYIFNPFSTGYNLLRFIALSLKLAKRIKEEKCDLVVTKGLLSNLYGSVACRLAKITCIWDVQEIVSGDKMFGLLRWVFCHWARLCPNHIAVSSSAMRDQFPKKIHTKVTIIPNGIDMNKYRPNVDGSAVKAEWGIHQNEILIGHIARFTYWKGQLDFIEAAKKVLEVIPHAKFALVGAPVFDNEDYEKELKQKVRDLKLEDRVFFPGFRDDLAAVLAAMDVFVHSSIEAEGCPLTLLTAMSMGKPCVVTKVIGNIEIVTGSDQAVLVPPKTPDAIAKAIVEIIQNKELENNLRKGAQNRIREKYSLSVCTKTWENIFIST